MSIRIITDTSSDFDPAQLRAQGIHLVSMTINVGDKSYADGVDLSKADFYDMLLSDEMVPKTSQPAPLDFIDLFQEAKDAGEDAIVILVSGALSGTVQSALAAKGMVGYDRVHIVDSRCASAGIQLLVNEAVRLSNEGKTAEEIVEFLDELKSRIHIFLGIHTLKYLYRGGRLSRVEAGLGTLANVHPILQLKNGALDVHSKCMGVKKTFRKLAEVIQSIPRDQNYPMRFLYSYDDCNCRTLMQFFPGSGDSDMLEIGPTLAAHAGPGIFAAVFVEAKA